MKYHGVFVSDLDGTLLDDARKISPKNQGALAKLKNKQVLRVIATGRSLYTTKQCLPANFPMDYLIASTGSHILDWQTGQVLRATALSPEDTQNITHLLVDLDVNFMVHDLFPHNHFFAYYRGSVVNEDFERRLQIYKTLGREINSWTALGPAAQIIIILTAQEMEVFDHITQACAHLSVIRATSPLDDQSIWVEIFASQVSKATGLAQILKHHGLDQTLTAAIGNDHNDQDMLDFVHLPYIVENAFIDNNSKYHITPDNNNHAVSYAIEHFTKVLLGVSQK